jgi:magnesium-transporting ATPase (P-type)
VSTGDSTVFGHIAKLSSEPKTGLTTLEIEVLRFVGIICSFIVTMIVLVIIVWYVIDSAKKFSISQLIFFPFRFCQLLGLHTFANIIPIGSVCLL